MQRDPEWIRASGIATTTMSTISPTGSSHSAPGLEHRPDEYDLERSHELERLLDRDAEREPA